MKHLAMVSAVDYRWTDVSVGVLESWHDAAVKVDVWEVTETSCIVINIQTHNSNRHAG